MHTNTVSACYWPLNPKADQLVATLNGIFVTALSHTVFLLSYVVWREEITNDLLYVSGCSDVIFSQY